MSNIGKSEFEFERLCSIFGLAAVRKASIEHFSALLALEGFMRLVDKNYQLNTSESLF